MRLGLILSEVAQGFRRNLSMVVSVILVTFISLTFFGAAILRKVDLSLVIAGTNEETVNPLWHGEIDALNRFYQLSDRPDSRNLIFLATHEPCPMCMSAITQERKIRDRYDALSSQYQDSKGDNAIPLG